MQIPFGRRSFIRDSTMLAVTLALPSWATALSRQPVPAGRRIGIIGLDTSHSVAFTGLFNAPDAAPELRGYKVVAACPFGGRDIISATKNIPANTAKLEGMGIRIVDSIGQLLAFCDVVLLETNDGRLHLEQALPVFEARKPLFIDKPVAASAAGAEAIFNAAAKHSVPVFSSSALRFVAGMEAIRRGDHGRVLGADTYSPCTLEPTHPDLYWYGIHGVEMLYAIMGAGCRKLTRLHTRDTDLVTAEWADGRIGSFRGMRLGPPDFGGTIFTEKGNIPAGKFEGYQLLVAAIARFFDTGVAPVSAAETIEICRFMDAAEESKRRGGEVVELL
ncbi:Gfo/Idh/MocA family protein [Flavihumibacter stibioxidans]|uniref:Dehydrogenase n=1 Tax=Flavihumibacter stibioxidans TaxID=1834163 RepID=A0ABR7M8M9_9BACT|nr:Gfo/Idh/MocA family oxidoreductase [Flavihumibacter stibioxidans]MBC6491390.1 dehydrogenase [Flavihumibacter stibioxidans]